MSFVIKRWSLSTLACLWVGLSGCGPDDCDDHVERLEACGLRYTRPVCDTAAGRCLAACNARASCADLDRSTPPPVLQQCYSRCVETFACADGAMVVQARWECDGEADCSDGSDEHEGCRYFTCESGQLVPADAECDEQVQCSDRSDETQCGYFLCALDGETIPADAECDGQAQCDDGSDEWGCP